MDGFERTSTRALVDRAGTNLVAIHYHFGSKEALYRAAAEHIGATILERNRAVVERGQALTADANATRPELVEAVCAIYDQFATNVLSDSVRECWRSFIAREQLQPSSTGAFEAMYTAISPLFTAAFGLVGRLLGLPAEHPEVRLLSMMILGQASVFRTTRAGALRMLGWEKLGPEELREIRAVGRKYIVKLLAPPEEDAGRKGSRTPDDEPAQRALSF